MGELKICAPINPLGISIIKSKNYEITLKKDAKNSAFLSFDSKS